MNFAPLPCPTSQCDGTCAKPELPVGDHAESAASQHELDGSSWPKPNTSAKSRTYNSGSSRCRSNASRLPLTQSRSASEPLKQIRLAFATSPAELRYGLKRGARRIIAQPIHPTAQPSEPANGRWQIARWPSSGRPLTTSEHGSNEQRCGR